MQAYYIIVVITVLVSFWVSEGLLLVPLSNHMRARRTSFFCSPTGEGNAPLKRLFIFGLGYVGAELATALAEESQFIVSGTCTNIKKMESLQKIGIRSYLFDAEAGKMFQSEALEDLSLASELMPFSSKSLFA